MSIKCCEKISELENSHYVASIADFFAIINHLVNEGHISYSEIYEIFSKDSFNYFSGISLGYRECKKIRKKEINI